MKRQLVGALALAATLTFTLVQNAEAGKLRRLLYYNYPGANITNLYGPNAFGSVTFPDLPDGVDYMPPALSGVVSPPFNAETINNSGGNDYGGLVEGYLTAPETGAYTFWLASDDESMLFMTTDSTTPTDKTKTNLLCHVPVWSNYREFTKYPEQKSGSVNLEAGKTYYIQILHKEGGGGDHINIGWQLPSGVIEQPMPAWHFQPVRDTRWMEQDVEVILGPVNPRDPANFDYMIYDGNLTVVYANVNLDPPVTYQWLRNGAIVPGATQAYYLLRPTMADNNTQWSVRVNGTITSDPQTMFVIQDKPAVLSATMAAQNPLQITVRYSEDVNPVSATNVARYSINAATIQSATLSQDGRTVTLTMATLLQQGNLYTLNISGVQDYANNTMDPASFNFVVAEGALSFRYWDFRPTDLGTLRYWSDTNSVAPSYINNLYREQRVINTTTYQWNLSPALENYMAQVIGYLTPPETGLYRFALSSDDQGIIYLGTSNDRASKREICNTSGSTGQWNIGAQVNQKSDLIYLEAGKSYYFEAVYRDGTGGDGISLFWQTPSGAAFPVGTTAQAAVQPFLIPIQYLSTYATPPVAGGVTFRYWDTFPTDFAQLRTWGTNGYSYRQNQFVGERFITTTTYQWPLRDPLRNDNMGQMVGYITAPETGSYHFGIGCDDHAILYLGTDETVASKREILSRNGSGAQWRVTNVTTTAVSLQAGKRYYFEAIYRDGGGGDGVTVVWYTPSMAANFVAWPVTTENQAAVTPYLIPAQYLSAYSTNTFGYAGFQQNLPASLSAPAGTRPTLSVTAKGSIFYGYQWYKDGAPITGATAPSYTLPYVQAADNNATYFVVVNNSFSSATSAVSTLTVTADAALPLVAKAGSLYKQVVEVQMSEPVTSASAAAPGNYLLTTIGGASVAVTSAALDPNDSTRVTLQTGVMPDGLMTLVVQNLADLSGSVMAPSTNVFRANNFDAVTRIGNTQPYGAIASGETVVLTAGGSDIWGTGDQGALLHKTVSGNFDYQVQGKVLHGNDNWTKFGLMVRDGTAAGARNLFNAWTPYMGQDDFIAQVRETTGGSSTSAEDNNGNQLYVNRQPLPAGVGGGPGRPDVDFPSWLRLKRYGDTVHFYRSYDATNWIYWTWFDSAASAGGAFPAEMLIGIALTSHNTSQSTDGEVASFGPVVPIPLQFTMQPTNLTIMENGTAYFYAGVTGNAPPYAFQWLKNGAPIQDATNATLAYYPVSFCNDQSASIVCQATSLYGETINSTPAILTVLQDTIKPTVAFPLVPKINYTPNQVKLVFSEMVDTTTAQTAGNYQITSVPGNTPLSVSTATLDVDGRTVILATATQVAGTTYKVVINNVLDRACQPPNAVAANTTEYFFYAGAPTAFGQRGDGYIIMEAEHAQLVEAAGDGDLFERQTARPGYSGEGYMNVPNGRGAGATTPTTGTLRSGTGSKMVYYINFNRTGRHIIWIRCWNESATAGNDDSIYVGFNDTVGTTDPTADYLVGMSTDAENSQMTSWGGSAFSWRSDRSTGTDPVTFTNTSLGLHRFIIWHREDGTLVDKIVLEQSDRAAGNTAAPAPCTSNGGLGDIESWDGVIAPPAGPAISILTPVNNQGFQVGANISLTASVTSGSPVALVEYFQGTNLLGTATTAPYAATWSSVPAGVYTITARVTDILGYQATSVGVQIFVDSVKPVAWAVGSLGGTGIGVYFNDESFLDPVSATTTANYVVNGGAVQVTSAVLEPDNKAVLLTLNPTISGAFTVQISNVKDVANNQVDAATLQSAVVTGPIHTDVGARDILDPNIFTDPVLPGTAQAIGTNGYYVRAGGSDIWNTNDGMHFVGTQITGNFDVAVRVASVLRADQWVKAGLMVRESLNGDSRNHLIAATPTNGVNLITMQWRTNTASITESIPAGGRPAPSPIPNAWLRVTRDAGLFTFYWGTNGTDWTSLYTTNLAVVAPAPYPDTLYVGLATTSHNNGTNAANLTTAYYLDLRGLEGQAKIVLTATVEGNDLVVSWPEANTGMTLQTQTNPINVGLGTGWTPVAGSQSTNRMYFPINTSSGTVFYRLTE